MQEHFLQTLPLGLKLFYEHPAFYGQRFLLKIFPVWNRQRFKQRTDLVRRADDRSLPRFRRDRGQRKHMPPDDILLVFVEGKIPLRILKRPLRMSEAVQPMRRIPFVPVIEEIIMQKRAPHHRPTIDPKVKKSYNH